jgi:hypothetical protein
MNSKAKEPRIKLVPLAYSKGLNGWDMKLIILFHSSKKLGLYFHYP